VFRRLRETAPAALVPFAWVVAAGAHLGAVSRHALFVAHVVMAVLLATFAVTGWTDMDRGVLRVWRAVVLVGFGATTLGVVGFLRATTPLLAVALHAWMWLPALGLVYTGRAVDGPAPAYVGGGVVCAVGALGYALLAPTPARIAGLVLVAAGQTAGIVDAVVRY
jgi:hypothetical protein